MGKKDYPFKRAKGAFLYDIKSNRYYDFQSNSNFLGHSDKRLTTIVKNFISSAWFIKNNSVFHNRLKTLFDRNFGGQYKLFFSHSPVEFFHRFISYTTGKKFEISVNGGGFAEWLSYNGINAETAGCEPHVILHDAASVYLETGGSSDAFKSKIENLNGKCINVLNYYWFPEVDITSGNADIIVMPEFYSGNFDYVLLLVRNDSKLLGDSRYFCREIEKAPSLCIASSLKYYHEAKKIPLDTAIVGMEGFRQCGRIIAYNGTRDYREIVDEFHYLNILLNPEPPYYSYTPQRLEEYQKNFIKRIKK